MLSLRFAAIMKPIAPTDLFDPRTGQPDATTEKLNREHALNNPGKGPMDPESPLVDYILKNTPDTIQIEFKRRPSPYHAARPDCDDLYAVISKDGQVEARQSFYNSSSGRYWNLLESLNTIVKLAKNKPLPPLEPDANEVAQPGPANPRVVITQVEGTETPDSRTRQLQELFRDPTTGEVNDAAWKIARDLQWKTDLSEFVLEKHPGIAVNMKQLPWPATVQLMSNGERDDHHERLFELSVSQNGTPRTRYLPNYPILNDNLTEWVTALLSQVIALGNNTFNPDTQQSPMDDYGDYADQWLKALPVENP